MLAISIIPKGAPASYIFTSQSEAMGVGQLVKSSIDATQNRCHGEMDYTEGSQEFTDADGWSFR
jgi:hypothetical protein